MADLDEANPVEPDSAGSAEEGRTALRVRRGAPVLAFVPLCLLLIIGVIWAIALDSSWLVWLVLGGIIVVVIGLIIAVNPRRSSPAGGTENR